MPRNIEYRRCSFLPIGLLVGFVPHRILRGLDWKQPDEGGKAAAYKIQRREGDSETWLDAGMAMDTETTLTNQPRGAGLEFRVVAVNKAGEGESSNGVLATL